MNIRFVNDNNLTAAANHRTGCVHRLVSDACDEAEDDEEERRASVTAEGPEACLEQDTGSWTVTGEKKKKREHEILI